MKSAAMALMAMKMVLMVAITNKEAHLDMIDNDGDGGDSEYDHVLVQFHW